MVNYSEAFRKPFKDIATLVIGIVLMIIPLINILTIPGYIVRVMAKTAQKDNKLPSITENFGGLVVDSIKAIIIGIVYVLPVAVIGAVLFVLFGGAALLTALLTGNVQSLAGLASLFAGLGIAVLITALLSLVFELLMVSALIEFAKSGNWGKAFSFGKVVSGALKGNFIIAYIISIVLYVVVSFIPLLPLIAAFPVAVIVSTWMAQAHEGL